MIKCSIKNASVDVKNEITTFAREHTIIPEVIPVRVCDKGIVSEYLQQQGFDVNDLVYVEEWDV